MKSPPLSGRIRLPLRLGVCPSRKANTSWQGCRKKWWRHRFISMVLASSLVRTAEGGSHKRLLPVHTSFRL